MTLRAQPEVLVPMAKASASFELADLLSEATGARERGDLERAERLYRRSLAAAPDWPPALLGLALCARGRGDDRAAYGLMEVAIEHGPDYREARFEFATLLRETGVLAEAEAQYRAALRSSPDWPPALLGLGLCARSRGTRDESLALLARTVDLAPDYRDARHEYATLLRETGQLAAAEACYDAVLAMAPDWPPAVLGLALCSTARGDLEAAGTRMRRALELDPAYLDARVEYGMLFLQQGDIDHAADQFDAASKLRPAAAAAWIGLARCAWRAGDVRHALAILSSAVCRIPADADLLFELAETERRLGCPEAATARLRPLASQPPTAGRAWTALGTNALHEGHLALAEACFRAALPLATSDSDVPALLARTLGRLGRTAEALALLASSRRSPSQRACELWLLRQLGEQARALGLARRAAPAAAGDLLLWHEWFETERFSGDPAALAACLGAAPSRNALERAYRSHAFGQIAEQTWDLTAAAEAYEQALRHDDQHSWLHESRARIAMLQLDPTRAARHMARAAQLLAMERGRGPEAADVGRTHLGRILATYLADQDAVADLVGLCSRSAPSRIPGLLGRIRQHPGHLPTAVAALVELRRADRFALPLQAGPGPAPIPGQIVQYWDKSPLPSEISNLMESFRRRNGDHRYVRHDATSARDYLLDHCGAEVTAAFDKAPDAAMKSDVFRLAWLHREGGVYADADDACLTPLTAFMPAGASFVAYQEEYGTLGNNFLAAIPRHPVIATALHWAVLALREDRPGLVWLTTGPGLISRAFAWHVAQHPTSLSGSLAGAAILSRAQLCRHVAIHRHLSYKQTAAHWLRAVTE